MFFVSQKYIISTIPVRFVIVVPKTDDSVSKLAKMGLIFDFS